ncbi:carboxy terminal-processing peptidase [Hymenobacter sp. HDW8]|uniref:carboxy terminal-processing peptidase n=1 Tax=Hymenobacter sp. HDW8 TaxID=2714932 RepID=UPI0014077AF8|nr:carboxy terminal-processing peptidase [Hymenobacter sp. HDW8]QIL77076.1 carboxy terminal-processing peptidase [Hymenobacter sp. HDW8]
MLSTRAIATYGTVLLLGISGLTSFNSPPSWLSKDKVLVNNPKDEVLLKTLVQGLSEAHFQPLPVDDKFSQRVFKLYLKRLDSGHRFLLKSDVEQLRKYQNELDDELKKGDHPFLDLSTKLIEQRIGETQTLYRELLANPFDLTVAESFETDPDKLDYPADAAARRDYWHRLLKYQTLVQVSDMMDEQAKKAEKPLASKQAGPVTKRTAAELEAEARKRVLKYYDELFNDIKQTDAADRLALYASAVTNAYDPHTEYFAPQDKDNFDIALTGRLEGTGALLDEKDGQISVADIVPGSAAYRQGELKTGDIILRVAQGDAEPVDITGMRRDKVVKLIRGKKGTEVRLTVRKPDASTHVISIIRDVVIIEDTYAQSAVVNEGGRKIGYILLPSFYADFNHNGSRSSATDVKNELEKLKKAGVQGVVLDLRFNGGGSLQDAVEMAGLFVKNGPMVQIKSRQRAAQIIGDPDNDVQYEGPLVVLVNKYSASASEILAAAIQDYKRGLILGNTTYGKGTVQQMFDLDQVLPATFDNLKPFGSLKLTVQKYYRINGGSTQFKGVTPDVVVPDAYSTLGEGEQDTDYALPWDEIAPANYKTWSGAASLPQLVAASNNRVATSAGLKLITESVQRMQKRKNDTKVSLNLAGYRAEQELTRAASNKYTESQKLLPALEITPLNLTASTATTADTTLTNRASRFVKPLRKDLALREAVAVIKDAL